jgi:hypothetical protein
VPGQPELKYIHTAIKSMELKAFRRYFKGKMEKNNKESRIYLDSSTLLVAGIHTKIKLESN